MKAEDFSKVRAFMGSPISESKVESEFVPPEPVGDLTKNFSESSLENLEKEDRENVDLAYKTSQEFTRRLNELAKERENL